MGQMADVYNDGNVPFSETIGDVTYQIPPGKSIRLRRSEAVKVMGSSSGLAPDHPLAPGDGGREKILRIVRLGEETEKRFISSKNGEEFKTKEELSAHLKQFEDEVEKTTKVYVCATCDFEAKSKQGLLKHMETHNDTNTNIL